MNKQVFEIKTTVFEGPFDLLLFFIEREELDIHAVSLGKITKDFLRYLQQMQELNMEVASEFILVAATLMRIKARTLLPKPAMEEQENELDLQEDLVQKLIAYKKFKSLCEELKVLEAIRMQCFERGNIEYDLRGLEQENEPMEELASFDLFKLMKTFERLMGKRVSSEEVRHTIVQYPYTIEEQKRAIAALVELNQKLDFHSVLSHSENRVQFVYNFLAILELLQQQVLEVELGIGYNNFSIQAKKE